jgi:hypothetical protein
VLDVRGLYGYPNWEERLSKYSDGSERERRPKIYEYF